MSDFSILRFNQIDSTNTYALTHLDALRDRQVILAERQTGGYGRFKRGWTSDVPDNIYMSIVLKPVLELDADCPITNLSQFLSLVLCDTLEYYNVQAEIKWPNDVLVNGAKIAGVLCEASIRDNVLKGVVLGAGINLNWETGEIQRIEQPATALSLVTGTDIKRDEFLENLLAAFFKEYEPLLDTGFPFIRERYMQRIPFLGKRIRVNTQEQPLTGIAEGFTESGCLVLQTDRDGERIVSAGDVLV